MTKERLSCTLHDLFFLDTPTIEKVTSNGMHIRLYSEKIVTENIKETEINETNHTNLKHLHVQIHYIL